VERIDEARQESRAYYLTLGRDLPPETMLVDEAHNEAGKLTHYVCELQMSYEAADHIMEYYRRQFVGDHVPAQSLHRQTLDEVLAELSATCAKHECRKERRCCRERERQQNDAKLRKQAREKRINEKAGRR